MQTPFQGSAPQFFGHSVDPATDTYLFNYEQLEWCANLGFKVSGLPVAIYGNYVQNLGAVCGALTDSDFGGGGTDNEGFVLRGAYALTDRVNAGFSYFTYSRAFAQVGGQLH